MVFTQQDMDKLVFERSYKYLDQPVIVTSGGSITPIFLNGENVIGDRASEYLNYKMDPVGMYEWVQEQLKSSTDFKQVIKFVVSNIDSNGIDMISGGRTRDWPFSAALAFELGLPALFLYKPEDGSNPILISPDGKTITSPKTLKGKNVFHIVDLVTTASSIINSSGGWINQIRNLDGNIKQIYSIIDRNQGAESNIAKLDASLQSAVQINSEWLKKYDSKHLEIVATYLENPVLWSINYLMKNGIGCLMPYLNPITSQAKKDNRVLKFVALNYDKLRVCGILEHIIDNSGSFRAVVDVERGINAGENFKIALANYQNYLL